MCDRHPRFNLNMGDRVNAKKDGLATTLDRARKIARARNERQRVTIHGGPFVHGFVIQGAARFQAWEAERDEHR